MEESSFLSHLVTVNATLAIPLGLVAYQISRYIYNIFFHPLRKFPGPITAAASPIPNIRHNLKGNLVNWVCDLHAQYGDVVRISPNELSFSGADAYRDIYGHKKAGQPTLNKDPRFYRNPGEESSGIVNASFEDHARMRRIFSHAFSDRALKMQEPLFLTYVDKLVRKIRDNSTANPQQKYNMVKLYNFTTFDIMSDLTFGEPLNMLDDGSYHPWIAAILAGFRLGVYLHSIRYFPLLESLMFRYCIPESILKNHQLHNEFSRARVDRRLEKKEARPDIWGLVLQRDDASGLSRKEMYGNTNIFMIAGTETTATLLSGLTFHLLHNPDKLRLLTQEIREAFETEKDITIEKLQSLKYLHACLEEGLRMYPPVPNALPRITTVSTNIDGKNVPAGTSVGVTNLAAYRNPDNFKNPNQFVPERWLGDSPLYAQDKKHGFQPFSTGPRACLGKNMAYHEMRLILTKLLFNFDLVLCEESQQWIDQKIFIIWDKTPLYCQLTPITA
ncbi:putative cytochrome P450 [Acrodontium crateriforme]|uniref:Cytochrome P450 n=1 Tax=Acrodontium crateriforme TaxID=150365 RepID=A0AAQ3M965_9PEZI|nr:putative cytochrome P450 [Acrodontium crateriforme]